MSSADTSLDFGATIRGFTAGQKVLGRYTLARLLGRGGMGVVWLARDEELEREIALKFLPEVVAMDKEAVRDMKRETRRCLELTHTHIVRIYDFIQDPSAAAIAMEYIDGATLAARKVEEPNGHFEVADLQGWVEQALAALEYAHTRRKVVHRDIKPANLMVDGQGFLKVADFGIAASVTDSVSRVSAQNSGAGTAVYMSPQQMMGEKPAVTDDVYAVGATLYELLTGKPPFYSGNVLMQVQSKVPPTIADRRADLGGTSSGTIPPVWEETIAACLAKETKDRPQSAREVAERLGLVSSETGSKQPSGAAATTAPKAESLAPKLGAAAAAEPSSRREVPAPERRSRTGLYVGVAAAVIALVGGGYYFGVHRPEQVRKAELARLEQEAKRAADEKEKARLVAEAEQLRTRQERAAREAARLAAARGGIIVKTEPAGAEVTVGALEHGVSPVTVKEAKLGRYPVKAKLAGYDEYSGEVEVKENEFSEVSAKLVRSTGSVVITSEPSGLSYELSSSGEKTERGTTPATLGKIPTGDYTLTVTRQGWPEVKQTVKVERGVEAKGQAAFSGGNLEITSEPSGAEVYGAGKKLGVTPLSFTDLPPSDFAFDFRLQGYKSASVRGEVKAKETARASAKLVKKPGAEIGKHWTIPELEIEMVPIAPGTFVMGSENGDNDEKPLTKVTSTRPYWLGATEVTQVQYAAVMGVNPSGFKGDKFPVETVSWEEAMEYGRKVTEQERAIGRLPVGYVYTLPSEAQWEFACRAGTTGDYAGDLAVMGWYYVNSGYSTHAVETKQANGWGLFDMHGNVYEWCADSYADKLPGGNVIDPRGAGSTSGHVYRGGSWDNYASGCRSADRRWDVQGYRSNNLGFRLALCPVATEGNAATSPDKTAKTEGVLDDVSIDILSDELRKQLGVPATLQGVLVTAVAAGGPSERAGVRISDVIVELDRQPTRNVEDAVKLSEAIKGPKILVLVWRDGRNRYIVVDETGK